MNKNDVTLVIGGSGSLGRTVVETLAKSHKRLAFTFCNNEEEAKSLQSRFNCSGMRLDLNKLDTFTDFVDSVERDIGPIGVLIFCSACGQSGENMEFFNTSSAQWDMATLIDYKGPFFLTQAVSERMVKRKRGKIIFTGSADEVKSLPSPPLITANKSAIAGLMRSLSKELGEFGILVNSVAPGLLGGGLSKSLPEKLFKEFKKFSCLNRLGKFQEIANVIAWLASDKNTYLVGQSVFVDGGI